MNMVWFIIPSKTREWTSTYTAQACCKTCKGSPAPEFPGSGREGGGSRECGDWPKRGKRALFAGCPDFSPTSKEAKDRLRRVYEPSGSAGSGLQDLQKKRSNMADRLGEALKSQQKGKELLDPKQRTNPDNNWGSGGKGGVGRLFSRV